MKVNRDDHRMDTTLGELIATVSDGAIENSDDAKDVYDLMRLVLMEILQNASLRGEIINRPCF